jgi:hypothetical protein
MPAKSEPARDILVTEIAVKIGATFLPATAGKGHIKIDDKGRVTVAYDIADSANFFKKGPATVAEIPFSHEAHVIFDLRNADHCKESHSVQLELTSNTDDVTFIRSSSQDIDTTGDGDKRESGNLLL